MKNILETILEHKEHEVKLYKKQFDRSLSEESKPNPLPCSFIKKLEQSDTLQVIAEIKRGSPSKGLFAPDLNIVEQARKYEQAGAGAISVLTDKNYFYGGFEDAEQVRSVVDLPILCKDFIIDEVQIDMAKSIGANIILLIVAAHSPERLKELLNDAKSKGLEVLVEVHNKEELDIALALDHRLIGINNRNLKTFVTDIEVSLDLIKNIHRPDVFFISESGIRTSADVKRLANAGFKGVLVGESLIRNGVQGTLIDDITQVRGDAYDTD